MADHTPTFADLCCAIAEGQVAATVDGPMYKMSAFELRRFLNTFRSLPAITTTADQPPSSPTDATSWSAPINISVA